MKMSARLWKVKEIERERSVGHTHTHTRTHTHTHTHTHIQTTIICKWSLDEVPKRTNPLQTEGGGGVGGGGGGGGVGGGGEGRSSTLSVPPLPPPFPPLPPPPFDGCRGRPPQSEVNLGHYHSVRERWKAPVQCGRGGSVVLGVVVGVVVVGVW